MRQSQERSRERILTQADPAKVRKSSDAIVLKEGSVFLVATEGGDIPFRLPHGFGLFCNDCRVLDGYDLTLNDTAPTILSGVGVRGGETHHHLANPEMPDREGKGTIAKHTIEVRRRRLIRDGVVHELVSIANYGRREARLRVTVHFRSKFQDLFVVKGFVRQAQGSLRAPEVGKERVQLCYEGRDGIVRTTTILFSPAPDRLDDERAIFDLDVSPQERLDLAITIAPGESRAGTSGGASARPKTPLAVVKRWPEQPAALDMGHPVAESGNPLVDRVFHCSLLDLHLLRSHLDGLDYFAAGIPWFVTLFGRDAATVALQTLPYGTAMARQTLRLLARYQATEVDEYRDAAPGKILHEFRTGELANLDAIPQSPAYYGTVDATPLFLILFSEYVSWSADLELARELRSNIDAALGWMERHADSDGDGYLDYAGKYENGLVNQGWKDSGNAIVNADGSLVEPPVALCEVQAYAYRAWREAALLLRRLGDPAAGETADHHADQIRSQFDDDFWDDALGCYVLARQAGGRAAAVVSSNAGQVLWGGIATPERAARVAERLMAPDMFSGWGIRTLSEEATSYNPMSYHLGSVWPHDNSLILAGFRRYGHDEAALRVFNALFDAASNFRSYRLPELFCGYDRSESEHCPVAYPVACSPQAWAAASLPYALWTLLGLWPDAEKRRLEVRRPRLPDWLLPLEIRGLQVGDARVDLRFARASTHEKLDVQASVQAGTLHVHHTEESAPPDSFE